MDWLIKKLVSGGVRKVLVALAVLLVDRGVLDQSDLPTIVSKIVELSPAIAAFLWDYYEKHKDARVLKVATDASRLTPERLALEAKTAKLR